MNPSVIVGLLLVLAVLLFLILAFGWKYARKEKKDNHDHVTEKLLSSMSSYRHKTGRQKLQPPLKRSEMPSQNRANVQNIDADTRQLTNGNERPIGYYHTSDSSHQSLPRRKLSVKQMVEEAKRKSRMSQQYGTGIKLNDMALNAKDHDMLSVERQKNKFILSLPKQYDDKEDPYSPHTYRTETNTTIPRSKVNMKTMQKQPYKTVDLNTFVKDIRGKRPTEKQIQQSAGIRVHSSLGNSEEGSVSGNEYRSKIARNYESSPMSRYYYDKKNHLSPYSRDDTTFDSLSGEESSSCYTQSPQRYPVYKPREHMQTANRERRPKDILSHQETSGAYQTTQYMKTKARQQLSDASPEFLSSETHQELRPFEDVFTNNMMQNEQNIVRAKPFEQQFSNSKLTNFNRPLSTIRPLSPSFKVSPSTSPQPSDHFSPRKQQQSPTSTSTHEHKTSQVSASAHDSHLSIEKQRSPGVNIYQKASDLRTEIKQSPKFDCPEEVHAEDIRNELLATKKTDNKQMKVSSHFHSEQQPPPYIDYNQQKVDIHNNDSEFNDDSVVAQRKDFIVKSSLDNVLPESEFNPGKTSTPQQSETNFPENNAALTYKRVTLPAQPDNGSNSTPKGNTKKNNGSTLHSILKKRREAIVVSSIDILSHEFDTSSFWDDDYKANDKSKNAESTVQECEAEEQYEASAINFSEDTLSRSLPEKIATIRCIREDPDVIALFDNIRAKRKS